MSDMGRQSLGDKVGAAVKPDSQKTYLEQAGDAIKGKADSAASTAQPASEKSWTQSAGDALSGNQNKSSGGVIDSVKDTLGLNNNANTNTKNI